MKAHSIDPPAGQEGSPSSPGGMGPSRLSAPAPGVHGLSPTDTVPSMLMSSTGTAKSGGGDPDANRRIVEAWYSEHRGVLVKLLAQRWNPEDTEDAVEDAFLKLRLCAEDLSQIREPRAFLRVRALNELRNEYQRKARLAGLSWQLTPAEAENADGATREDLLDRVRGLLTREPRKRARALRELILHGKTLREISLILGISRRTISQWRKTFFAKCRRLVCQGSVQSKNPPPHNITLASCHKPTTTPEEPKNSMNKNLLIASLSAAVVAGPTIASAEIDETNPYNDERTGVGDYQSGGLVGGSFVSWYIGEVQSTNLGHAGTQGLIQPNDHWRVFDTIENGIQTQQYAFSRWTY